MSEEMRKWLKGQKADNTRMHYPCIYPYTFSTGEGKGGATGRIFKSSIVE